MKNNKDDNMDIDKATLLVINYFERIHGNLNMLSFRVGNVKPNTLDNVWIVECNFYPSLGSKNRIYYVVKVNIKEKRITLINKVEEPKIETKE